MDMSTQRHAWSYTRSKIEDRNKKSFLLCFIRKKLGFCFFINHRLGPDLPGVTKAFGKQSE